MTDTVTYGPLDPDAYMHQARILQSLHYARPVWFEGKQHFVQAAPARLAGGRVEMEVYLMGSHAALDSAQIQITNESTMTSNEGATHE